MRRVFFVFMLISSILWSQDFKVVNKLELKNIQPEGYYYPTLNYDGTKILLSKESYKGLYLYDLNTKEITVISEGANAGYKPMFTEDDSKIIYQNDYYDGVKRYSDLMIYDIATKETKTLLKKERNLKLVKEINGNGLIATAESGTKSFSLQDLSFTENSVNKSFAYTDAEKIIISRNGMISEFKPFEEGYYIWVSANSNKLLYQCTGKGTFVTDLLNNNNYSIGYANAPIFTPDGNYVIYMNDRDDGHNVYASDILISSFDGKTTYNLTQSVDDLEMYPAISGNGRYIAYCTTDGRIYILEVSY